MRLRAVAEVAARAGAEVVATAWPDRTGDWAGREVTEKGLGDYVTEADRAAQRAVLAVLRGSTPGVAMIAEEDGAGLDRRGVHGLPEGVGEGSAWVVDPLDGTTNFLLGIPLVAVSVAFVAGGRPVAGAIEAPLLGLSFSAARGSGARSGGRAGGALRVATRPPERAVVATGFPTRDRSLLPRYRPAFDRILASVDDVRRTGSAALDLAWVASGALDGFFHLSLGPWDLAAGVLLVEEAGGVVTDWEGGDRHLATGDVLAGSPATHRALLAATSHRRARR